jgi:microcystin-dependent protein
MTRILHTKIETGQPMLATDITNLTFFPVGTILMMDGSWENGRGGWYICDGQNDTPDLRDTFIKGSGSETEPGANWRQLITANLPSHNHTLAASGGHTHNVTVHDTTHHNTPNEIDYSAGEYGSYHSATFTTSSGGSHTHTVGSTGSGETFNNMPAYYSVVYIKKMREYI